MDGESIFRNIECGNFKLITKRKGKSALWTLFCEIENENKIIIDGWLACRECKKVYKFNGKQTSNFHRHKCFTKQTQNLPKTKLSEEIKNKTINVLTDWVIEDCRPFNAVSGTGFRKMAQFLIALGANHGDNIDIEDLLPSPTTISRRVNKLAIEEKNKLKDEIPEVIRKNKASMTIDMWTDPYVKRNFLCATFHYEKNLELKEIVLGMKSMDFMNSNGENIRSKMLTLMENFGINNLAKIKFITDRGSNIKSALKDEIRLNCTNHLLSNAIDAAFEENIEIE